MLLGPDGETLELAADHRRHVEVENSIRDLKYGVRVNHMPSGCFDANGGVVPRPSPLQLPHPPRLPSASFGGFGLKLCHLPVY